MDLFHRNAAKWVSVYPEDKNTIDKLEALTDCAAPLPPPFPMSLCSTVSGKPNLKVDFPNSGGPVYLHSHEDPELEAKEWFASQDLLNVQMIYVYGIGLGYYYDAALDWLKADKDRYLVFLEDDIEILRFFLGTEKCAEMLENSQVYMCFLTGRKERVGQFTKLTSLFVTLSYVYTSLESYRKYKPETWGEYKATISFLSTMNALLHSESIAHGLAFFRNFYLNILEMPHSYFGNNLKDKFKGVPAIICGAGPSLNKNIEVLSTLYDRALIFAGGTALNALNGKDVMPHFGVGIDPNPDQYTRLIMNHGFELPFLYRCRMLYEAISMAHGDHLYLSGSGGYEVGKWLEEKLGIEDIQLQEGFNVLNFSVMIAHSMGCNPIICAGIDLAYSEGLSYADGVTSHPIHSRQVNFRTKKVEDELVSKLDIYGRPIYTLWKWIAESMWYTHFADSHPECTLINATEGGIGFPGVVNMPLAEVKEKYLDKQLDLKSLIHGEIQNSPLPETVTEENIVDLIRALMESLSRCGESCLKLMRLLELEVSHPQEDKELEEKIAEENSKLLDELAYGIILKRFDEDQAIRKTLDLRRIEIDKTQFSEEDYLRKKAIMKMEHYHSLRETSLVNANLGSELLKWRAGYNERLSAENKQKDSSAQKLREEYLVPSPKPNEIYHLDDKIFVIKDPELQLDYSEDLSLKSPGKDRIITESLFYPSGKVKMEKHYRGNILHGPSTYYTENGNVISKAWYMDGRQEGKMWTNYHNGSINSLQRFEKGLPIGIHQYFHANGLPRSILPYKKGVLHGEVLLFSPAGIMVRRLTFVEGKRTGQEQIWNDEGALIIECQYEGDKPIGLARMWHHNGVLAREFIYDKDYRRIEAKEWDMEGNLIVEAKNKNEDYFDLVNRETDKLTASLNDMVSKVTEIAPLIVERFPFHGTPAIQSEDQAPPQNNLSEELFKLKQEMEHLLLLDSKMKEQLGGHSGSAVEAIWKTPTSRREMEKQFEGVREKLNSSLEDIQKGISKVVKSLKEKSEKPPPGGI